MKRKRKGWHHSEEAKRKIGAASKRLWQTPGYREKTCQKIQASWDGNVARKKQVSRSIRKAFKLMGGSPMSGGHHSKATKEKMSFAQKGIPKSLAHRQAMSNAFKARSKGWALRERSIENAVVNWWRAKGFFAFKIDPHHCVGAPDRMFIVPGGKPTFMEFKRPGGIREASKLQLRFLTKLNFWGYNVIVTDSKEEAITYLQLRLNDPRSH